MGIYIEGIKKPKSCSECFGFSGWSYGYIYCEVMSYVYNEKEGCCINQIFTRQELQARDKRVPDWCPLKELDLED